MVAWAVVDVGILTVEEVRTINQDVVSAGITIDLDSGFCYNANGDNVDCP